MSTRQYFSELERSLLIELVDKYKETLESKKNDYKCIKAKSEAWTKVADNFNSQNGVVKRDVKQLKKCWDNIKSSAKKVLGKDARETKLTGGGKKDTVPNEEAQAIAAIIPAQIQSLENEFDDDGDNHTEKDKVRHDTDTDTDESSDVVIPKKSVERKSTAKAAVTARTSTMSEAQSTVLKMQAEQHVLEVEILRKKSEHMNEEHKRKLEVLDLKHKYWSAKIAKINETP
ncbi:myb/SANT-like DNA-binding domain-containing protein 3 [Lineus longissimus]|uniref:myb/SANT-like DNA-binding domain-containing protein 3 n=1 Tax=Lineus longissimus TaxID=88925 RepID=UPI00315D5A7B